MSQVVQTQFEFARLLKLIEAPLEPDLWFQELRLLHRFSSSKEAQIRRIPFREGLNILWSPPDDSDEEAALYKEAWGGHAAGKTLFCRILRYLLGDTNYCTESVFQNIKSKFADGWAIARIRILNQSWIVGRSLASHTESFAVEGNDLDDLLQKERPIEGFSHFLNQLETLASACLKTLYPEEAWRHFLPWLARDQEARYARVTAWRDSLSEADNPSTSMSKQYALMRAVLGLLDPSENELQADIEQRENDIKKAQPLLANLGAVEARERQLLSNNSQQVLKKGIDFTDAKAALTTLNSHLEVRQEALAQIENELETEAIRGAREEYETAVNSSTRERNDAEGHRQRRESLMKQGNELMGTVDRIKSAGITDPKRAAEGWCPHTVKWAEKRGCVEFSDTDDLSSVTIEELETQANQYLFAAEAAETERSRCESRLEQLEAVQKARSKDYAAALRDRRQATSKIQKEVTLLEEYEKGLKAYIDTQKSLKTLQAEYDSKVSKQAQQRDEVDKLRKDAAQDLRYLNEVYADVIKAVVGASVDGFVTIDGNGMHLHATKLGELSGAALETVKTLAFDLAGVVAGIEGKCAHPRFLIHDGPREADMARIIYEHFFVYAVDRLEGSFSGPANFQYILTTTTAPPKKMQEGSVWLIEKLNSRNKAERLFCEDI